MFTLTKVLSLFVYPLSLGVFLIGLSLLGQLRGNRATAGLYVLRAYGALLPSTEFGVEAIAKPLEADIPRFLQRSTLMVVPLLYWVVVLKPGVYGRWRFESPRTV